MGRLCVKHFLHYYLKICCFDSHANSAVSLNYNISKPNIYSFLAASITLLNILAIQWNLYTTVTLLRHLHLVLLLCFYIKIPNEAKTLAKNNMMIISKRNFFNRDI